MRTHLDGVELTQARRKEILAPRVDRNSGRNNQGVGMRVVRSCRAEECYEDALTTRTIGLQVRDPDGYDSTAFVDVPLCHGHNVALDNDLAGAHALPTE
jgi:hypothetical protein